MEEGGTMKTLGVLGGLLVLVLILGGFTVFDLFGAMIGVAGGLFGLMVGIVAGLFGAAVGLVAAVFGAFVAFAVTLFTIGLPILLLFALVVAIVKLSALA
jgi:hypothetical protein